MRCILGARMNMKADILRQGASVDIPAVPVVDPDNTEYGEWVAEQDPLTHEIVRVWKPRPIVADDPSTPNVTEMLSVETIRCEARGIITHGATGLGNVESFDNVYMETEMVRIKFPKTVILSRRDRITNIRNKNGQVIWKDEEVNPFATSGWRATIFDVQGVTPVLDAYSNHIENLAMLKKAEAY